MKTKYSYPKMGPTAAKLVKCKGLSEREVCRKMRMGSSSFTDLKKK